MLPLAALAFYAFYWEPSSLRLNRYDIALEQAGELAGLKIAVISDLHAGAPYIDLAKVDRVVAMTNAAKPDLILLTGDLAAPMQGDSALETIARHLKPLRAPRGVFAVIGNHERWENAERMTRLLESAGIPVLENNNRAVSTGRGIFYLAGIGDDFSHEARPAVALAGVPRAADALCFTHSPDVFRALPRTCALTVAGHTHGGQVKLPLLGRLIVPSRFGSRYAAGVVREGHKTLFVSTGIGTSIIPVRLGVPPEIALLEIR